jgi:hypothetical protein
MKNSIPPEVLRRVRKLAQLPEEARHCTFAVSVTRLTVLKSPCQQSGAAGRFVTYLARKTLEHVEQGKGRSSHRGTQTDLAHRQWMSEALDELEAWQRRPTEGRREALRDLLVRMQEEQNEYRKIAWGAVRLVNDWELLLFEYALHCLLNPPSEADAQG